MPLPPDTLTTERLVLRPLRMDDVEDVHPALSDPVATQYWARPPHASLDETRAMMGRMLAEPSRAFWALTLADGPAADRAMGWIMMKDVRDGVGEVGYILKRDAWGKGYAKESLAAVLAYGFDELGLHRIQADTDPDNARSIGLLERLGFVREARLRAAWKTHIGLRDTLVLAAFNEGAIARAD